jgi:hypothetical protein
MFVNIIRNSYSPWQTHNHIDVTFNHEADNRSSSIRRQVVVEIVVVLVVVVVVVVVVLVMV